MGVSNTLLGASFITISSEAILTSERSLVVGNNISLADAGANSTVTLQTSKLSTISGLTTLTTSSNAVQLCNANAAGFVVNLPAAAGSIEKIFYIKKIDLTTNTITITPNGAEKIDGLSSFPVNTPYHSLHLICDGSNWYIL